MGQTLTTGVYLPDEGERNCYTGLAGNWQALDNHLGNANIHVTYEDKQAWNNHIADTVKHVTAADKQAWNGKADASALTAHTGDTTIHVTAEDKAKWDTVTGKANDADVVHKSGDETIAGSKTLSSINGVEPSSLSLPDLANRIDISSYITALNSANSEYTPSVNGWISIRSANATKISIRDKVTNVGNTSLSNTANYLTVTTPVVANRPVYITVMCTSLSHAYFIPCLGNV